MTDKAYVNGITWSPWMKWNNHDCPQYAEVLPVVPCSNYGNSFYPPQDMVKAGNSAKGKDFDWSAIEWFRIPMDDFCRLTGLNFSRTDEYDPSVSYIAQDANGDWYGYPEKPVLELGYWQGTPEKNFNDLRKFSQTICHERDTLICVDDYKEYLGLAEDSKEEIVAGGEPKIIDELGHYQQDNGDTVKVFDIQGNLAIGEGTNGCVHIFHAKTGLVWNNGFGWVNDDDKIMGKAMTLSEKAKLLHPEIPWECFEDNVDRIEYLSNNSAFIGNSTYTERVPHTIKIPRYWSDGSEITDVVIHRNYEDN